MIPAAQHLYAQWLSRKGEHARALAVRQNPGPSVLSRAGMHISVLSRCGPHTLEAAIALAEMGRTKDSLAIAAQYINKKKSRSLFGRLAVDQPEEVLSIVAGCAQHRAVQQYCHVRTQPDSVDDAVLEAMPELPRLAFCVRDGRQDLGRQTFNQLFSRHDLASPHLHGDGCQIDIHRLSCPVDRPAGHDRWSITVIVTAYNEAKYLKTSVASLLNQQVGNLEIIIVNDGSTDRTLAVATELSRQDSRIRLINLERNIGVWRARNIALQYATGDFVTVHDADDWAHPSKLLLQLQPLTENPRLQCSSSYFFRVAENSGEPYTRNACSYLRWNPSSVLFRRKVIDELGYYLTRYLGGDCEYVARMETRWGAACHRRVRKPLSIGLQRDDSLSSICRSSDDDGNPGRRIRDWEKWRNFHVRRVRSRNSLALYVGNDHSDANISAGQGDVAQ